MGKVYLLVNYDQIQLINMLVKKNITLYETVKCKIVEKIYYKNIKIVEIYYE